MFCVTVSTNFLSRDSCWVVEMRAYRLTAYYSGQQWPVLRMLRTILPGSAQKPGQFVDIDSGSSSLQPAAACMLLFAHVGMPELVWSKRWSQWSHRALFSSTFLCVLLIGFCCCCCCCCCWGWPPAAPWWLTTWITGAAAAVRAWRLMTIMICQ